MAPDCWIMAIGTCVCNVWSQHLVSRFDVVDAGAQVGGGNLIQQGPASDVLRSSTWKAHRGFAMSILVASSTLAIRRRKTWTFS